MTEADLHNLMAFQNCTSSTCQLFAMQPSNMSNVALLNSTWVPMGLAGAGQHYHAIEVTL